MKQIPDNLPAGTTHFCPAFGRYPDRALRLEPCDKWAYWTGFSWFDLLHAPPPSVRREAIDLRLPRAGQAYATWDGEDLPPVGIEVETVCGGIVRRVKILAITDQSIFMRQVEDGREGLFDRLNPGSRTFRPIRTAEQIAAEERENAVEQMLNHSPVGRSVFAKDFCESLYDAGARMPGEGPKA